jgi:hypothetical protein
MLNFKIVNNTSEITLDSSQWLPAKKFNCKNRVVEYNGLKYQIIEKRERDFSSLERAGRGLLGVVAVICTLCLALLFKSVRNLFTKSKENIRFAMIAPSSLPSTSKAILLPQLGAKAQVLLQQGPKPEGPKILPCDALSAKNIEDSIQHFKKKALEIDVKGSQKQRSAEDFTLTPEQKKSLLEADKNKFISSQHSGAKTIRGGCTFVIFLDSVPGFVFKPMEGEKEAKAYIETTHRAQQVVSKNHLHLLHIPQAKLVEIGGKYFVMQEKADLLFSDYEGIKGVYDLAWDNKDMHGYVKAVFLQMITFITETGFSDVKYDNLPLTREGRVALIDLDQNSAVTGLTKGGAGKKDGLFHYIPLEYFDEFLGEVKKLNGTIYQQLEEKMASIRVDVQKEAEEQKEYLQFCKEGNISYSSQQINPALLKMFDDEKKQQFAVYIVKLLNQKLLSARNFSVKEGRRILLNINVSGSIFEDAKKIFAQENLPYQNHVQKEAVTFKTLLPQVLEGLKKAGYIFDYKISPYYPDVTVCC